MNPRARPGRQPPPAFAHAGEHGFCFGVIGDLARVGARQEQVRAGRRQRPLQEAVQDPERVLDAVPPGQRDDHRVPVPVRCPVGVQAPWDDRRAVAVDPSVRW